jgi:enoyl-CoA hydratase
VTNYPTQIATAIQDGIAVVTLNRPERRNAMTVGMVAQLRAELSRLGDDRDCRVIVLTGGGSAFCSGLELNEVHAAADRQQYPAVDRVALQEQFSAAILLIRRLRQPVIAAVHGAAIGAGFGLVLAADIRIVACSAKFLVGAVGIGLSAGECGISYHLPRVVGAGRAFEAMLTGRPIDADEALRIGIASRIVDKAELLSLRRGRSPSTARTLSNIRNRSCGPT